MTSQPEPLTEQQLDDIEARKDAATPGPWMRKAELASHIVYIDNAAPDDGTLSPLWNAEWATEADGEFTAHARTDVPALLAEVRRLRARALTASEYDAAWHAVEGAAGEEGADPGTVLHAVLDRLGIAWQDAAYPAAAVNTLPTAEELADAPNPVQLRWGLDDVQYGDDDSVIVMLSGPDGEPYWLELDAERAAVLRRDLAGPDGEQPGPDTLPAWLHRRFAGGVPAWEFLDDGDRAYWEHQAAAVRRAVARGGFKTSAPTTP